MTVGLQILDASVPAERARWTALHAAWSDREVFAHPAYVELFAGPTDRTLAAVAEGADGLVLYPFIQRAIVDGATDLTTAYGYGGPFRVHGTVDDAELWAKFGAWAREHGVVSEFVRFGLFEEALATYPGEREQKLVNVVRDLTVDEAAIWSDFDHKVRKNVNKAKRDGVTIEIDETGGRLDDFLRIYEGTMDRRDAQRGYYFGRAFFETIVAHLRGQFVFLHALLDGRVVSTELALVSANNVYSYLGGTDSGAFDQRPNDLLKHELILWAKRAGKRRFVLGGGYALDDGIFRYKKAFAPTGMVPYFVGRRVLDRERYDALAAARLADGRAIDPAYVPDPGFFPAYRAGLPR